MTERELKKLNRRELLEIMIDQSKELTSLRKKLQQMELEMDNRRVIIAESGTMSEAVLKLNGLLADADKAAAQYLENIRLNEEESRRVLEEARTQAESMILEAEAIRDRKIEEGNLYLKQVENSILTFTENPPEPESSAGKTPIVIDYEEYEEDEEE